MSNKWGEAFVASAFIEGPEVFVEGYSERSGIDKYGQPKYGVDRETPSGVRRVFNFCTNLIVSPVLLAPIATGGGAACLLAKPMAHSYRFLLGALDAASFIGFVMASSLALMLGGKLTRSIIKDEDIQPLLKDHPKATRNGLVIGFVLPILISTAMTSQSHDRIRQWLDTPEQVALKAPKP